MSARAALYARFSTEKQSESSIDDQFRECERIAQRHDLTVVACFNDAAISGGTTRRPGYQSLLSAARRREFDVIVAEDTSRLWRNLAEQSPRLAELADLGIQVVTHDLDTRHESSAIMGAIGGAMASAYRQEIGRRTRRGLEGLARSGRSTGGRAYGFIAACDSQTGCIEIDSGQLRKTWPNGRGGEPVLGNGPDQAAVVTRIFTMYAEGVSARKIAAALNADGVPSPGASWNRTSRRSAGWLASAIHGDITRGTGMLNNARYTGVIVWGRSQWTRSAADSSKRRRIMNKTALHSTTNEGLRIIPQELWDRVKARQKAVSRDVGDRIKVGQRRNAPGAGRPPKYLFSGLLACAECGASFVLRNRTCYACASWWNGAACANKINVPRTVVEKVMLDGIRQDLADPALIKEFEVRARAAMRQSGEPKADQRRRVAQLRQEVQNLTDAIASGMLRGSPALARRLQAAENELAQQESVRDVKRPTFIVPNIRRAFAELSAGIDQVLLHDPERGRQELRGILGDRIKLIPDESRTFLIADYSLGLAALQLPNANAEIMVAGAGFEPATFGL